jgi:hypothetical protein
MSANAEEQMYKNGMRKDPDGFMDIDWCSSKVISSWDDLRATFQVANGRKAIAPTQFNPMSTRGHCVMVLEIDMPNPEQEGMRQRGRVYVCDLAGTEPAGDIVYALYDKVNFDDGTFEYKFKGAHPDAKKTKELQDQGKKINLSLSEMAQFFMKMAEAVMKKKLTPGMTIPGCNSFFLCKYLKDTMLQARTYLFCAIRPEVEFLKYTFATLGFAKNASVVKLAPKKAGGAAMTPAEKKLMAELDQMKALVAQMQAMQAAGGSSSDPAAAALIADLQSKLLAKQTDLANEVNGMGAKDNSAKIEEERMQRQKEEYGRRGIHIVALEKDSNVDPYFINIDDDAFRSHRFMYIIRKPDIVFGAKCDIQLMSLSVVKEHCHVKIEGEQVFLVGGKGDTFHNGKKVKEGDKQLLTIFDRIAMGDQLMMFRWPKFEVGSSIVEMNADDCVLEYQEGITAARNSGSGGGGGQMSSELEEERRKLVEERQKWESEKEQGANAQKEKRNEEEYQRAMQAVDNTILDLLPKIKEAKQTVDLMNRVTISFDVVLEKGNDHIPKVKISVTNSNPPMTILIDPQEFLSKTSLLKDELMKLKSAIDGGRTYELPERHDPVYLMFDNYYHLGTATHWPEYLAYNLETDNEEKMQEIKNSAVPYNTVGLLEVRWRPLADEDDDGTKQCVDISDPDADLIGKPWTYKLSIKKATDLPIFCEIAYVQYDFFGETFVTEAVQQTTFSPVFEYTKVHHVNNVTKEFLAFLKSSLEMHVYVTQHIDAPKDKIGTNNEIVVDSVKSGEPKGYNSAGVVKPKSDYEIRCEKLESTLSKVQDENQELKQRIQELELLMNQNNIAPPPITESKSKSKIAGAVALDSALHDN